jgi:hypothetical protein
LDRLTHLTFRKERTSQSQCSTVCHNGPCWPLKYKTQCKCRCHSLELPSYSQFCRLLKGTTSSPNPVIHKTQHILTTAIVEGRATWCWCLPASSLSSLRLPGLVSPLHFLRLLALCYSWLWTPCSKASASNSCLAHPCIHLPTLVAIYAGHKVGAIQEKSVAWHQWA